MWFRQTRGHMPRQIIWPPTHATDVTEWAVGQQFNLPLLPLRASCAMSLLRRLCRCISPPIAFVEAQTHPHAALGSNETHVDVIVPDGGVPLHITFVGCRAFDGLKLRIRAQHPNWLPSQCHRPPLVAVISRPPAPLNFNQSPKGFSDGRNYPVWVLRSDAQLQAIEGPTPDKGNVQGYSTIRNNDIHMGLIAVKGGMRVGLCLDKGDVREGKYIDKAGATKTLHTRHGAGAVGG
ncbi:hypothetical protein C8F04DRAFT_1238589 [Mycena alexandri]|uniref:Uncharacterized protein n=1 Tax=Mycena alexandri TaxID=1745969 RepID=A0AAD6SEH1_9AGAR|nr:hypothetical protein C8F04DRAFT_1238589 [Mycena alexandri]